MTTSEGAQVPTCPTCGQGMRRELDGVRVPPMPRVFWFCVNGDCQEGRQNQVYRGG